MNDPRRPEWSDPTQQAELYPRGADPAYSNQYWDSPEYTQGYMAPRTQPAEAQPPYWQHGGGYPPPSSSKPPRSPHWLWALAAAAVLLVVGLVIALVIVTTSAKESTMVAPLSPVPSSTTPRLTTTTPTPSPPPSAAPTPSPTTITVPPTASSTPRSTTAPSGTDTVVYNVSGEGRAINITYVDTDGMLQTEFNVLLPWSKQVSLSSPSRGSASVAVVNVGRDIICSVSVNGVQIRQRTGRGLTICTAAE